MFKPLQVLSYNIRYNNPHDGANAWPHRRERVAALLQKYQPALIGLQEVLHGQLMRLATALPAYDWVGVGRDDGAEAGEYAPIFYHRERLALLNSGHFWLSETPDQAGSFGWDAACVRVATWALLRDLTTNSTFLHLNTHLDHRGMTAQLESVRLLQSFLAHHAPEHPAIITGDFNCTPTSPTYEALTTLSQAGLLGFQDAMHLSSTLHQGPTATFTSDFADPLQDKIDYIFLYCAPSAPKSFAVTHHSVLDDQTAGRYPSDHLPVLAELAWC